MARPVPAVAVPHTYGDAELAIRHTAPMAHVLAAIYFKGAGLRGDLHVIAANRESDVSPALDFVQLEHGVAISDRQERLPELADGLYALHGGAVRRQDDRVWRIGPKDCFSVAAVKGTRGLAQTPANLRLDVFILDLLVCALQMLGT